LHEGGNESDSPEMKRRKIEETIPKEKVNVIPEATK